MAGCMHTDPADRAGRAGLLQRGPVAQPPPLRTATPAKPAGIMDSRSYYVPLLAAACSMLVACGSSATNVVGPTLDRCQVSVSSNTTSFQAAGGKGTLGISTTRECSWTVSADVSWVEIPAPTTGQGEAKVDFSVRENPASASRRGGISVSGERIEVAQEGTPCRFELSHFDHAVEAAGGSSSVQVQTIDGCSWAAESNAGWVRVLEGSTGSGSGAVWFEVARNDGPERAGTISIAENTFSVVQRGAGAACTYTMSPLAGSFGPAGGELTVSVAAPPGCAWTTTSNAGWITVLNGQSGTGNGTVRFRVAANTGAARTATLLIAGQTFVLSQQAASAPCTYSIDPTSGSVGSGGGELTIQVSTQPGCGWSASSNVGWVGIIEGATGSSSGAVRLAVTANTGTARTGTVTMAGQTFTLSQDAASPSCTYSIDPASGSVGAEGGEVTVQVSTQPGCGWSASSNVGWVSIIEGVTGSGSGAARLAVTANTGTARTGTVTIAGQTFTLSQAAAELSCSYSINPTGRSTGRNGGENTVNVRAPAGCAWTATSNAAWITILQGAGTGDGTVVYRADQNPGDSRTGTITIAGQVFILTQQGNQIEFGRSGFPYDGVVVAGVQAVVAPAATRSEAGRYRWSVIEGSDGPSCQVILP
jgi:hypothetical protein